MALKLRNRILYPFIFPIGVATVIACWFYFADGRGAELLVTGIGIVAGFTYFLYRQHLDEAKLFNELFIEFNARYDKLKAGLNKIRLGSDKVALTEHERELLFSYFNLCAEEFLFYKAGCIDYDVWKSWRKGMNEFFTHHRVRELWKTEETDSYYGFSPLSPD